MKRPLLAAVAYGAVGVFTFGHSASVTRVCWNRLSGDPIACDTRAIGTVAFISAIGWPLYWSWHAQADANTLPGDHQ